MVLTSGEVSPQARAVRRGLRREVGDSARSVEDDRRDWDAACADDPLAAGTLSEPVVIDGVTCLRLQPLTVERDGVVVHVHGGGLVAGSLVTHRAFASHLAMATGREVVVPDYRLLPEAPRDDVAAVLTGLAERLGGPVAVVGDSSGAAVALAAMCSLRDAGRPLPHAFVAISGAFDATLDTARRSGAERSDPLLSLAALEAWQDVVRGAGDLAGEVLSPLRADLRGLPPMLLLAGEHELWRGDSVRLHESVTAAGGRATLSIHDGMWHTWPMWTDLPESRVALVEVRRFLDGWLPPTLGTMRYLSTRGDTTPRRFCDILLEGLAPDGGLYLPTHYPSVDDATLTRWRGLSYADLAVEVLTLFVDDIPDADLRALVEATYTEEVFGDHAITPLRRLGEGLWLQALSNGPTLAFKDMAMQLLGALFEYELDRRGEDLNILGATSGDTGSAAEYAMRGRDGIRVFMLSPRGRMSPFQQAQMFSLMDPNIHNIAVEGVFDDAQDIVKAVSGDLDFKRRWRIGTVNSINWARLLAQVVYYVAGYLRATTANDERVSFTVPSGNFGNVCAGHVARCMGIPIRRLVVATNENDVLAEFFRTGTYRVRGGAETHRTSSPSMDISKASNFERFVHDLVGRDAERTAQLFGPELAEHGHFTVTDEEFARIGSFGFHAGTSTHDDRLATIARVHREHGVLVDPHTADGVTVATRLLAREPSDDGAGPAEPMIVLETALAAKFAETIEEAVGIQPDRPEHLRGLEDLPRRVQVMQPDATAVKRYIESHAG